MGREPEEYLYFRAAGKSLNAITLHQILQAEAEEDIQAFVMLCGAERALGRNRISGLHFSGTLPRGWVKNASAPLMAVPDPTSALGHALAEEMESLRLPGDEAFAALIGAEAAPSTLNPAAPVISVVWPTYEKLCDGWVIKCPITPAGYATIPPDAKPMTEGEYLAKLAPLDHSFNFLSFKPSNRN